MSECLFCKIVKKEIPAEIIYENDDVLAFRDISPQAPVHVLVIPKKHVSDVSEVSDSTLLGKMAEAATIVAKQDSIDDGYRLVINKGEKAGQTVFHLHMHLLGGRALTWPPG